MPSSQLPVGNPDRPQDDKGDADAVQWLLTQKGGSDWTYQTLFESLRRQPARLETAPERVQQAEQFATEYGVRQIEIQRGNRTLVRFKRTDSQAPSYSDGRG